MIAVLNKAEAEGSPLLYNYKTEDGKDNSETLIVHYGMIRCLVSILYLFGKRISEVLDLQRKDLFTKGGYLNVKFRVLKKTKRSSLALPVSKLKRVSLNRSMPFTKYIIDYVVNLKDIELPLFPGNSRPHIRLVRVKDKQTGKVKKEYRYEIKDRGLMSRVTAYKILKALNPEAYPHWFRHSLATQLAEEGHTAHEPKDWFDWSRYDTAVHYVEGMPSMTQKISNRKLS